MVRVALWLPLVIGCSRKAEPPRAEPPAGPSDAGVAVHVEPGLDPAGAPGDEPAGHIVARPAPPRAGRPIDIVLRSSPPGATVAVDGVQVGTTPTYWAGEANGREHEFTFVRDGYAYARYRFVPITSGVVHARLEAITDDGDAGVPPEMIRIAPEPVARDAVADPPDAAPAVAPGPSP